MGNISDMVIAMQGWGDSLSPVMDKPKGSWGRKIIVKTGQVYIDGDSLDVEFSVPFDDDTEANEAEIVVYNLTQTTISQIKYDADITLTAGYTNDTGVIFSGKVSSVTTRWVGRDKKTTITAIDSSSLKERKIESVSYAKGTKASYILKDLIGRLKVPIAVFNIKRDHTYTDAVNADGGLMEQIKKQAKVCGVSAYILKGKAYVRDIRDGDDIGFIVKADTGLIGSPEEFEENEENEGYKDTIKGYSVEMLLQHRITTGAVLKLQSMNANGTFRVRSGEHKFDGTDFVTTFKCI